MLVEKMKIAPVPGMNLATVNLIERFKEGKQDDTLSADELREVTGHDCRPAHHGRGYSYLRSAIKYCLNNYGILWAWQRDRGVVECLGDNGKLHAAADLQKRSYRMSKRQLKVLKATDPKGLDGDEDRREHAARVAVAATMIEASATKTMKRLTADRRDTGAVDPKRLLAAILE